MSPAGRGLATQPPLSTGLAPTNMCKNGGGQRKQKDPILSVSWNLIIEFYSWKGALEISHIFRPAVVCAHL